MYKSKEISKKIPPMKFGLVLRNGEKLKVAPIKGYGKYLISDNGKIFNAKSGKELKSYKSRHGYLFVILYLNGVPKNHYVHRIMIEAFFGRLPKDLQTNHLNGNKSDNRLENLEVVTPWGNIQHAIENGLIKTTPVLQICPTTFKVIGEYKSIHEAERKTGVFCGNISNAINGNRRTAGKFLWARKGFFNPQINGFQLALNFN